MTKELAKIYATQQVHFNMNRADIEEACKKRGIRVPKCRFTMEEKLIKALSEEYINPKNINS